MLLSHCNPVPARAPVARRARAPRRAAAAARDTRGAPARDMSRTSRPASRTLCCKIYNYFMKVRFQL